MNPFMFIFNITLERCFKKERKRFAEYLKYHHHHRKSCPVQFTSGIKLVIHNRHDREIQVAKHIDKYTGT